ncbi:hypothetical protein VPH35_063931 [Triticum aestivum]
MEEVAAAAMAVLLPDDLLLEILVRMKDDAALFRCATTCKQWRRLVADPSFLRRCWPEDHSSSSFVGIFTRIRERRRRGGDADPTPVMAPCFIPAPQSTLGPDGRYLISFLSTAPVGLFDHADRVYLVITHAVPLVLPCLVLVRLFKAPDTTGYADPAILQLAVCNLLAGTCDVLPPLNFSSAFNDYMWNGYAILTGTDCPSEDEPLLPVPPINPSFFKVVIIGSGHDDLMYTLHVFSSDKARWGMRSNCFNTNVQSHRYGSFSDAVVCRGMAHWVFYYYECFHLINMNGRTGHISWTKLHSGAGIHYLSQPCLTLAVNGTLSLLWMRKGDSRLEIWEHHEDHANMGNTSKWLPSRTIKLKQPGKRIEGRELCILREKCGTLLISDSSGCVYTADLETGMMAQLVDWPDRRSILPWDAMPLDMDWPMIFVSRLIRYS